MTDPKIAPCPYCADGGDPQALESYRYSARVVDVDYVKCRECGARGPHRPTFEQAITDWNEVEKETLRAKVEIFNLRMANESLSRDHSSLQKQIFDARVEIKAKDEIIEGLREERRQQARIIERLLN